MAATPDILEGLRRILGTRQDVEFAVLFGSAVSRGLDQARDVDVAIAFSRSPGLLEIGALAIQLESVAGKEVDIVDLADASTLLRWEVARTGRPLVVSDRTAWIAFMTAVPIEWADLEPYFVRESEGLRRALVKEAEWSASTSSEPKSIG